MTYFFFSFFFYLSVVSVVGLSRFPRVSVFYFRMLNSGSEGTYKSHFRRYIQHLGFTDVNAKTITFETGEISRDQFSRIMVSYCQI